MTSFLQLQKTILSFFFLLTLFGNTQIILAQAAPGGVSSGLEFWVKADSGVYEDISTSGGSVDATEEGDVVEAWHDVSGNGYHLDDSQTGTPTYRALSINYNPSVEFDGNGDFLEWNENNIPWFEADNELTIYSVVDADVMGTRGWIDTETADDSSEQLFISQRNGENGTFNIGADGTGGPNYLVTDTDIRTTDPMIIGFTYDGGESTANTIYDAFIDGLEYSIAGTNTASGTISTNVDKFSLGNGESGAGNEDWDGLISEVFTYDRVLTPTERRQVESYLAIKYGKTLDQTTPTNYLASDGTTNPWANDADGYDSDIFGIGRDDDSALNQKISTSVNSGSILTIALEEDFTSENSAAGRTIVHANDKQFAMVAHNGAATTTQTTELDVTSGFNLRLAREWKIDATNFNQSVSVKFEGFDETWTVIATVDGDFSSNVEIVGSLNADGELTTPNPPADGTVFTLAKFQKAPGGVTNGIALWISSDQQVFSDLGSTNAANNDEIVQWNDQSSNSNDFTQTNPEKPTFLDNSINFNPQVYFGGTQAMDALSITGMPSGSNARLMRVVATQTAAFTGNHVPFGHGVETDSQANVLAGSSTNNSLIYGSWGAVNDITSTTFWELDVPHIIGGGYDGVSTSYLQADGATLVSDTDGAPPTWNTVNTRMRIGADIALTTGQFWTGNIAEVIVYDADITGAEQQKIDSYLALKYGISMSVDYVASDDTYIWSNDSDGYDTDIFGIGRDDDSNLNQKVSKSINPGSILTIALDNDFTSSNTDAARTISHINDLQFLAFANNGGATSVQYNEIDGTSFNTRIAREWKVDKTANFSHTINLRFEGFDETWTLLKDTDGDFSAGTTSLGALDVNGEITGVTLTDGDFLTLAKFQEAPGGVFADLNLWLRADQGLVGSSNASEWTDHSPNDNNAVQAAGDKQPMISENATNFHTSIDFDGTDDIMNFDNDLGLNGDNAFTIFGIMQMPTVPAKSAIIATDGCGDGFAWYQENAGGDPGKIAVTQCGTAGSLGNLAIAGETTMRMVSRANAGSHVFLKEGGSQVNGDAYTFTSANMVLGETNGLFSDIRLSELVVFNRELSVNESYQVHSYLALKYGITLDQAIATDYVASVDMVIWSATNNVGYTNDIFGIGRDDASGLNQKVSESVNDNTILTLALDADFTTANNDAGRTTDHANDLQFLMVANNGDDTTEQFTETDGTTFNTRIAREWKVDKTANFSQSVSLKFEGFDETWTLLKDSDGDFASGATSLGTLDANGEITGVTLADGDFLTLAKLQEAPGGVLSNITLWLKADAGTSGTVDGEVISTWDDQSGGDNDMNEAVPNQGPQYLSNGINFNPVADFVTANNGHMENTQDIDPDALDPKQIYIVYDLDGNPVHPLMGNDDNNYDTQVGPHAINGDGMDATAHASAASTNQPHILVADLNHGIVNGSFARVDGQQFGNFTYDNANGGAAVNALGKGYLASASTFQGNIAEAIIFGGGTLPTGTGRRKIETYLAIKYGITLDQSTVVSNDGTGDYVLSDGTVVFDAHDGTGINTYNFDIFGIGRDDNSGLDQKISRSINDATGPILATIQDFTAANNDGGRSSLDDGNFIILGHDNSVNTFTASYNGGTNNRLSRVWKVSETGTVGNIYFAVPYAAYTFPSGGAPSVVISNDTTFDDADETIVLTYDRASGMYSAQINPADGDYITLVISEISLTTPAYYRGSSGGDGNTTTDGVTRYGTYSDFITDTNGVYASFSQHWSFGDSFFADGIYFYRTNNVISEIVRYPSIEDLGANTNGVIFNLSQTWILCLGGSVF